MPDLSDVVEATPTICRALPGGRLALKKEREPPFSWYVTASAVTTTAGRVPRARTMKHIADEIRSKQDAIEQLMVDAVPGGQPEQEKRQFVRGFLVLVMAAAEGDESPRDDYLEAVIPGCKQAGMEFTYIVGAMVSVSMILAASVSREALPWTIAFLTDYTARMIAVWQRS